MEVREVVLDIVGFLGFVVREREAVGSFRLICKARADYGSDQGLEPYLDERRSSTHSA